MPMCPLLLPLLLAVSGGAAVDRVATEAAARRVADRLLAETTWRLRDTATGMTYDESSDLAPSATVIVDSRFNGWYYQTLMVMQGMSRLGAQLDEPAYRAFAGKNLDFVARHEAWFRRQRAAGLMPKPVGERPEARMGYYFDCPALWMTGLAAPWIERGRIGGETLYADYTRRFAGLVDGNPRLMDGVLANGGQVIRSDDVYLMVPGILELWRLERDPARLEDAIRQALGTHAVLFQDADGLYRHSYEPRKDLWSRAYWGRGNGWMALAHPVLLEAVPTDHPRRDDLLGAYRAQMAGLRRWQDAAGGWRQVMDHPESWVETSCTGMCTYALARGVNEGWIDASFADDARRGWRALLAKLEADGTLVDTCPSTGPGDLQSYLTRPRARDDLHAYGPFLLAAAEMLRLDRGADAAWLREKGEVVFTDAFEREEDGNLARAIGNGWTSATADRVPDVKQADLDAGVLKVTCAPQAGHGAHIHHDASFVDGGAIVRFRLPGLNRHENLTIGFVDRDCPGIHAGHLFYAFVDGSPTILVRDHKTGVSDLEIRRRREPFLASKEPLPADLADLLAAKERRFSWKPDHEWHELVIAVEGDECRVSLDGVFLGGHRSPGFAHPVKRWFSLGVGSTAWVDEVTVFRVR